VVISIGMLTSRSDPAGYYLARRAGCAAEYYNGAGERAGVWLGRGAAAAGLAGELDGHGERVLRALLDGRDPDGRVLVAPVLRMDPRGRLPARPLVEAIRAEATRRGLAVEDLLPEATDRAVFAASAARVDRPRRRVVTVTPVRAGRLAAAADLDPQAVYRKDNGTSNAQDNRLDNFDRYAALRRGARAGDSAGGRAPAGDRCHRLRPEIGQRPLRPRRPGHRGGGAVRAPGRRQRGPRLPGIGRGARAARAPGRRPVLRTHRHAGVDRGGVRAPHLPCRRSPAAHASGDPEPGQGRRREVVRGRLQGRLLPRAHCVLPLPLRAARAAHLPPRRRLDNSGDGHRRNPECPGRPDQRLLYPSAADLQALRAAGRSGPDAAQAACLAIGPRKTSAEPEQTLRERWAARARGPDTTPAR
jgi:hypothetical protein